MSDIVPKWEAIAVPELGERTMQVVELQAELTKLRAELRRIRDDWRTPGDDTWHRLNRILDGDEGRL